MNASTVTGRHWTRLSFEGPLASIELRDGAVGLEVFHPWDHDAQIVIIKDGAPWFAVVCCGPAAPYPADLRAGRCRTHLIPGCFTCWPLA